MDIVNGHPLFPGSDYQDQLMRILDVLGTPNMDDFNEITSEQSRCVFSKPFVWFARVCLLQTSLAGE